MFALEASRLARNNRDWHHLVDLSALTETLLIDSDGIYDPRQLNDRLVLELKRSEVGFELNLLRATRPRSVRAEGESVDLRCGNCRSGSSAPRKENLKKSRIGKCGEG